MKLSDAEWQIMNSLWDSHPASARQVGDRLPETVSWAYTTIKTMLTRLVEKGAVSERKEGNVSIYEPLVTRQQARRTALAELADQAFDGAFGPLVHFLFEEQKLSAKQRKQLLHSLGQDTLDGGAAK